MEKNIVEVVMNNKGEVVEKVADYIGVASFAAVIESLYRECLENFDDAEDLEEYIADVFEKNIQSLAWEFTHKANKEMKKYLHLNDQHMNGNFANLYEDYPKHRTGVWWASDYDGDDYYDLYPQMVARLDSAEDSEQANEDRAYLEHSDSISEATYRTNGILTRCVRLHESIRIPSSWRSRRCSMYATSISMRAM